MFQSFLFFFEPEITGRLIQKTGGNIDIQIK